MTFFLPRKSESLIFVFVSSISSKSGAGEPTFRGWLSAMLDGLPERGKGAKGGLIMTDDEVRAHQTSARPGGWARRHPQFHCGKLSARVADRAGADQGSAGEDAAELSGA